MSATYYLILTAYGAQRIAQLQADQTSAPLLVNFVAGDANGQPYLPQTRIAATALINQRISVPLQSVDVVDNDRCQAVAVLDTTVGGFNIHEIGITDSTGRLVYIGNYHGGYKPVLSEGAGGDLTLVLDLVASGIGTVIITPDPSFIYAGQDWVDANFVRIPTFNAHVAQNNLEHANLLLLIQQLTIALATAEENIMDTQTIQNIQTTLALMNQRLTLLEAKRERPLPIGTVIETTKPATFTAQDWATEFGYNSIWEEDEASAGRVIVGAGEVTIDYSAATGDAARPDASRTFAVGETGGELDHKLTPDELPEVTIDIPFGQRGGFWEGGNALHPRGTPTTTDITIEATLQGGETPLNLLPPFLVRKKFVLVGYQTAN